MMLWYKAWIETRWRFLICLVVMLIPSALLYHELGIAVDHHFVDLDRYAYGLLFAIHLPCVGIWMCAAVFLGLGGLLRERAVGTSTLELTLPVGRPYVIAARVGVGVGEAVALAIAPWLLNLLISAFMHTAFSVSQATWCVLLLVGGGLIYFAAAVLISSVVEGEFTAIAVMFGLVFLAEFLSANVEWLRMLDLFPLMRGTRFIDHKTSLFHGPPPLISLLASVAVAVLLVLASIGITERRDF